jgi:hypothetical protein
MAAPAFDTAGTVLGGSNSTAANVPVPAGVVADDIVLVLLYVETTHAVTPPAGFAEAPASPADVSAGIQSHDLHVYWRRATGADSGTYGFTLAAGVGWRSGVAMTISGCIATGSPFDTGTGAPNSAVKTTTADGSVPAVSLTTTGPDRLLVWMASCYNGGGTFDTVPGFTENIDPGAGESWAVDTKVQAVAGPSGSLTSAYGVAGATAAWLGALLPIPDVVTDTHGMLGLF